MLKRIKEWFSNNDALVFSRCGKCRSDRWFHRLDLDDRWRYAKECCDCGRVEWWSVPSFKERYGPRLVGWSDYYSPNAQKE